MAAPKTVEVTRFPKNADQNTRREFAKELVKALDEIKALDEMMVPPGVPFVVTTPEYIEKLEDDYADAKDRVDDAELEREQSESAVTAMTELVADYERGILDRDELLREVKSIGVADV